MKTNNALTPAQREAIIQKLYGSTATAQEQFLAIAIEQAAIELNRQGRGEPVALPLATHLFNSGYMAGHHDTVEGCFTDIHQPDMETYQDDVVGALLEELEAPQPAEPVPNGYDTPYNLGWAAGWDAHKRANPPEAQPADPVVKESLTVAEPVKVSDEDLWSLSRDCKVGGGWSQWSIDPVKFGRLLLTRYGRKS